MEKNEIFETNSSVVIDGTTIKTFKSDIVSANIIRVEVGTTGHCGGDTGHGGRTYFRVTNKASTDIRAKVKFRDGTETLTEDINSIELVFGGDCELDTFCEALRIGYEVLKTKACGINVDGNDALVENSLLEERRVRFSTYLNELCDLYRKQGNLKGMSEVRYKYHIAGITKQQFFECNLHHAKGHISRYFCDEVYSYVLDRTKTTPAPHL